MLAIPSKIRRLPIQYTYVNGRFVPYQDAVVPIEDRGYQFADGIYEVMAIKNGVLLDATLHLNRLERSLEGIDMVLPLSRQALDLKIAELLRRNNVRNGMLYMQFSRGVATREHAFPNQGKASFVMMTAHPQTPSPETYKTGAKAITLQDERWRRCDIKSISLLPNVLAKQQAKQDGAIEGILISQADVVTEGTASNVFMVDARGNLCTHPANQAILAGITRSVVLELAKLSGITIREIEFSKQQLIQAQEAFITSTTKGVLPISEIDGTMVGEGKAGEITTKLMIEYNKHVEAQL